MDDRDQIQSTDSAGLPVPAARTNRIEEASDGTVRKPEKENRGCRFQFSLGTLLFCLIPTLAIVSLWIRALLVAEELPYTVSSNGADTIISTERFDIVVEGVSTTSSSSGSFTLNGPVFSSGSIRHGEELVVSQEHTWMSGKLRLTVNGIQFLITENGRRFAVGGQSYRIKEKLLVTISAEGEVTVEQGM